MRVLNFLKYNNAVPLLIGVVFLGTASAFAATNPDTVYSQQQQVLSVDNTYIVSKDLSTYTPQVTITGVTEDTENYYVAYSLATIGLDDYVWKDTSRNESITVSKAGLGAYGDLGLYVTGKLKNVIDNELAYLRDVQDKEKKNISQKVVATSYGGLVGKLLDNTTETLPGYTPVVTPPVVADSASQNTAAVGGSSANTGAQTSGPAQSSTSLLTIQILGNNPAHIPIGAGFVDLGAVATGPDAPLGFKIFVDGAEQVSPSIDATVAGTHTIEYRGVDSAGTTVSVTRTVVVDPKPGTVEASSAPIEGDSATSTP